VTSLRTPSGRRVGLFGELGQGNLGNDGSMEAVMTYLTATHPDVILDALCTGPTLVSERYAMPATRLTWFDTSTSRRSGVGGLVRRGLELGAGTVIDTLRVVSWVSRHDSVIVPGMGVLEQTVPVRPWQRPYLVFVLSVSGRLLRTKVALVSVGTNVMHDRSTRWLFVTAARLAYYRSFRDSLSRTSLMTRSTPMSCSRGGHHDANRNHRLLWASASWTTPAETRTARKAP
jgi:polysaccharide pyruvyl transferase WcaK-like protein